MPDTPLLIKSVNELKVRVAALTDALEQDYLDRHEIEQGFTSRQSSRNKVYTVLLLGLLAILVSYFVTISTVSSCFLGEDHPSICNSIPGYSEASDRNARIFGEFRRLQHVTELNQKQIAQLERQQR